METKLDSLLIKEEQYRLSKNFPECLNISLKIINYLSASKTQEQIIFNIISKILFSDNQSNFVRIGVIFNIMYQNYFSANDSKNIKAKLYQLLIDSFKKDEINDQLEEKRKIISLFESSNLKNFKNLDSFILTLDTIYIKEKSNDNDIFNESEKKKSLLKFDGKMVDDFKNDLEEDLIRDESQHNEINEITQEGLVDNINKKSLDLASDIQTIFGKNLKENYIVDKISRKKYKVNNKLPMIVMSISANLNSSDFTKLVENTFIKLNYKNICTIRSTLYDNVKIYENTSHNYFKKMFSCLSHQKFFSKNVFQVSTIVQKDENNFSNGLNYFLNDNYERKLSIKSVKGNEKNIINFMLKYLKLFSSSINKVKIIKQSKTLYKYNLEKMINDIIASKKKLLMKNINLPKKKNMIKEQDETLVEKSNKKVNKYYEVYKILSNVEYELGKSVFDFIGNFKEKYKDAKNNDNTNTREIMIDIIKMIESTTNILNCNHHINNENDNYDSNFYNTATEQFIFNKIYHYLYEIYDIKYNKINSEFLLTRKELNENMQIKDILTSIGVKEIYISNDSLPFKSVIENANKIPFEKCLKNKFKILTQLSLEIRSCILEYTGGKKELESMDDELPIIIYLVTQIHIDNFFAELNMIDDYLKCSMRDELIQNKMVTNLLSSLYYVSNKWDKESKSFKN